MAPSGLTTLAGIGFMLFGLMHVVGRDHEPLQRSYFLGGIHLGYWTRVILGVVEIAFGGMLLLLL